MASVDKRADMIVAVMVSRSETFRQLGPRLVDAVKAEAAARRDTGEFIRGIKAVRVATMWNGRPLTMVRDWLVYNDSPFAAALELGFVRRLNDGSLYRQAPINAFRGAIERIERV